MSQFLTVAERLLTTERRPMTPRQLTELAHERGLLPDHFRGKTPYQTMKSKLCVAVRRDGEGSRFVRVGPGRFYLRNLLESGTEPYVSPPHRPAPPREQVLVVPAGALDELGRFQGIRTEEVDRYGALLVPGVCNWVDRHFAEEDDELKQIVTYVVVTQGDRVLAFRRGNYGHAATFLRGSWCVGFGGHVTAPDAATLFTYQDFGLVENVRRELNEELVLPDTDKLRLSSGDGLQLAGVINDDSSYVGVRHLAFVFRYDVSDDAAWRDPESGPSSVRRGEKSITQLHWLDTTAGDLGLHRFEYWSQLCLRAFFPESVQGQPAYVIRRKNALRPPHLLCVLGQVGSGKSEATHVLEQYLGYLPVNSGRVLAELIGIPPWPVTPRQLLQAAAEEFIRKPGGPQCLAQAIWQRAEQYGPRVAVDGIRQPETLAALRALASPRRVGVLYVHTPADIAFEFYESRSPQPVTWINFLAERNAAVEQEVAGMIANADAVLYNWTGKVAFANVVRELMAAGAPR